MNIHEILNALGIQSPQDAIYLYLLEARRATVFTISEKTGIYRPTIYRALPILIEKGLVSKVRVGKRTMYIAEHPAILSGFLEELETKLGEIIPELTRVYDSNQKRPVIRFYEGKKGIEHIYVDMMRSSKKGDSIYRYESPKDRKINARYYPALYLKRATGPEGEIEKYVITNEETHKNRRPGLTRHSKAIPEAYDPFDYNITELIYKNKVAFIDYDTETATLIENGRFASFQLKLFKLLFKKLE
jgi:sugar-specific transcriptional regulator TrmB